MQDNKHNQEKQTTGMDRRDFLKVAGAAVAATTVVAGCSGDDKANQHSTSRKQEPPVGQMTYRENPKTKDKVSILGYGMMRLPVEGGGSGREKSDAAIDQDMVNRQVDYAIEHGVNLFDTSPAYCQGRSEHATGIALKRHKRSEFFISTKLSNFAPQTWGLKESKEMFENSLKELQVDYVDYLMLHCCGLPADDINGKTLTGMEAFKARFIDNGLTDWLVSQRESGRIKNLGFSYHGDQAVFDLLLQWHDEGKYHFDFVLIELNYLDWKHAREINPRNTDAEYLYAELQKRNIPALVMEPLLGGRLANVPDYMVAKMKQRDPESSVASWAFRYAGTPAGVLSVLSGMTYMEHLKDNLLTYSPLKPISEEENTFLEGIANEMVGLKTIQCNDCKYCMPCPYGINIPAIFVHYNKCINEGNLVNSMMNERYAEARRAFLVGYDRSVPRLRQANHCIGCNQCVSHCPQQIDIPAELHRIDDYVEKLKRES